MSKHTPGTWTIEPHGDGFALYSGRGPMMHGLNLINMAEPDKNWEANARLIAASPELLSIVKRFIALPSRAWHPERHAAEEAELMQEAREVVAKAEAE